MNTIEQTTRPCYVIKYDGDKRLVGQWSGKSTPPALEQEVNVTMNGLGYGVVVDYFVASGYLGIKVRLNAPPAWFVKQNGGNVLANVFGAEIIN